jgi:hypothetical protein
MVPKLSAWESHAWSTRACEFESGIFVWQHTCCNCGRQFIEEPRARSLYAVHMNAGHFDRLSDETTDRWLRAFCAGERDKGDQADRETRFLKR